MTNANYSNPCATNWVIGSQQWYDAEMSAKLRGLAMYSYQMIGASGACYEEMRDQEDFLIACTAASRDLGPAASFDEIMHTAAGMLFVARKMAVGSVPMESAKVAHPYIRQEIFDAVYEIPSAW